MKISITVEVLGLEDVLQARITEQGLSRNDLAIALSQKGVRVSPQNIQKILGGKTKAVPLPTLQAIASGLNLNLDQQVLDAILKAIPQPGKKGKKS